MWFKGGGGVKIIKGMCGGVCSHVSYNALYEEFKWNQDSDLIYMRALCSLFPRETFADFDCPILKLEGSASKPRTWNDYMSSENRTGPDQTTHKLSKTTLMLS